MDEPYFSIPGLVFNERVEWEGVPPIREVIQRSDIDPGVKEELIALLTNKDGLRLDLVRPHGGHRNTELKDIKPIIVREIGKYVSVVRVFGNDCSLD